MQRIKQITIYLAIGIRIDMKQVAPTPKYRSGNNLLRTFIWNLPKTILTRKNVDIQNLPI